MKINFLEIAQIELDEAIKYYNYEVPGVILRIIFLSQSKNKITSLLGKNKVV
jgi:hypothetical protein